MSCFEKWGMLNSGPALVYHLYDIRIKIGFTMRVGGS